MPNFKPVDYSLPDIGYRKRDIRYEGQERHRAKPDALWDKSEKDKAKASSGRAISKLLRTSVT